VLGIIGESRSLVRGRGSFKIEVLVSRGESPTNEGGKELQPSGKKRQSQHFPRKEREDAGRGGGSKHN